MRETCEVHETLRNASCTLRHESIDYEPCVIHLRFEVLSCREIHSVGCLGDVTTYIVVVGTYSNVYVGLTKSLVQ